MAACYKPVRITDLLGLQNPRAGLGNNTLANFISEIVSFTERQSRKNVG